MSVTINPPQQLTVDTWRLTWSSDLSVEPGDVTFYVYRDGELLLTTRDTSLIVSAPGGPGSPVYEVLDDETTPAAPGYPATVILTWYASPSTRLYRVEELVSAVWTLRKEIADAGQGYFTWESRALADSATAQFRVTPIGTNGNAGTVVNFSILIVRYPDPPDISASYNAGTGALTLSAVTTSSPGPGF